MDSKISMGIPIETMLQVVGILEGSGIAAIIAPSRIEIGEVWLELNYSSTNAHQLDALKQISRTVNDWNRCKYGHNTANDIYKKLGL